MPSLKTRNRRTVRKVGICSFKDPRRGIMTHGGRNRPHPIPVQEKEVCHLRMPHLGYISPQCGLMGVGEVFHLDSFESCFGGGVSLTWFLAGFDVCTFNTVVHEGRKGKKYDESKG